MSENLFAACGAKGSLTAKRVPLDRKTQKEIIRMFHEQEDKFREGVKEEIAFDGRWQPDEDGCLIIPVPAEAKIFEEAVRGNAISVPEIDADKFNKEGTKTFFTKRMETSNEAKIFEEAVRGNAISVPEIDADKFNEEGIKAFFMGRVEASDEAKILVQQFTSRQALEGKATLFMDGKIFHKLPGPAFTLDSSLTCIIEGGMIKFKSQHKLRSIIDLREIYREATDQEVKGFAGHPRLIVEDVDEFTKATNQTSRKLIKEILSDNTLNLYEIKNIQEAAEVTGLKVVVKREKIVMPEEHKEIKALLQLLTESRYSGPLSRKPYISNSHRPAD